MSSSIVASVVAPQTSANTPGYALATDAIFDRPARRAKAGALAVVGVLPGEGIGAEVTEAALQVMRAAGARSGVEFAVEYGGAIGLPAVAASGQCLTGEVAAFCRSVFARGGAVLAGAGGGRFVYDFRKQFDLFIKLNPVVAWPEMDDVRVVKPEAARNVDMLVVRENLGGVYQGETRELPASDGGRVLEHRFYHPEAEARRFLGAAARLARQRRGQLALVHKAGGLPQLAGLWKSVGEAAAAAEGVEFRFLDIDFACYLMLQEARTLDVLAAPNCFADILSDLGGILMGGRGLTFGASYGSGGEAVYQTNHGAAYDMQGTGRGNPLGQILSMSLMLRESFGLVDEAAAIEAAVRRVLGGGVRTGDIAAAGGRAAGTAEITERIVAELQDR